MRVPWGQVSCLVASYVGFVTRVCLAGWRDAVTSGTGQLSGWRAMLVCDSGVPWGQVSCLVGEMRVALWVCLAGWRDAVTSGTGQLSGWRDAVTSGTGQLSGWRDACGFFSGRLLFGRNCSTYLTLCTPSPV